MQNNILQLSPVDRLELKKPHPCGGHQFQILRVGGEVRIVCTNCGRDMTLNRIKLENAIKKIIPNPKNEREDTKQHEEKN